MLRYGEQDFLDSMGNLGTGLGNVGHTLGASGLDSFVSRSSASGKPNFLGDRFVNGVGRIPLSPRQRRRNTRGFLMRNLRRSWSSLAIRGAAMVGILYVIWWR